MKLRFALLSLTCIAAGVQAQAPASSELNPERQVRVWAASCAACHGTDGRSTSAIPSIAGVDRAQLLAQLLAFKQGQRPATVMHQHAKGYTDAELTRLAEHFSRLPR